MALSSVETDFSGEASGIQELGNQSDQFKDLYLFMYQNVKEGPKSAAIEQMLLNPDYSAYAKEELEALILKGEINVISGKMGGSPTQSDLANAYRKISEDYEAELSLQSEHRGLAYESMAQEIFMNGDLSDSAQVDVLYDLDLIHYLLFGDYIEYPDRSGDKAVELASEVESKPVLTKVKVKSASSAPVETSSVEICTVDGALGEAVQTFDASHPEQAGSSSSSTSSASSSVSATSTSGSGSESASATADTKKSLDAFVESIGGSAGNWDRPLPCTDVFCITVDLIEGDAGISSEESVEEYDDTANCIACHVSYILAGLEMTLSKPVTPSKVSMNYFEDATCKEAGKKIGLDLNVYAVKKPIFSAPGDTIPDNPSKNVADLKADIEAARALTASDQITGEEAQAINQQRIIGRYDDASQEEVIRQILASNEAELDSLNELFDDFEIKARGQNAQDFGEQILGELATLKSYFEQFEASLKESITPLAALAGKKYCE